MEESGKVGGIENKVRGSAGKRGGEVVRMLSLALINSSW